MAFTIERTDTLNWDPNASHIVKREVSKGDIIFNQGEVGDAAYLVERGEILLFQSFGGRRVELGTIKKGEMFGEMAVIDDGQRMATAMALSDGSLSRIPRLLFEQKVKSSDKFIRGLLKVLLGNIRGTHSLFQRRPRSFRDKVLMLEDAADYIECFQMSLAEEQAKPLAAKLSELRALVEGFKALADTLPDSRHHAILELGERFESSDPAGN